MTEDQRLNDLSQGDDPLDFATKEDLDAIMADERLKRYYNAVKAGVTKKFQSWSQREKELASQLESLTQALDQWEQWRPIIEHIATNPDILTQLQDPNSAPSTYREAESGRRRRSSEEAYLQHLQQLAAAMEEAKSQYDQKIASLERALDLSLQLSDLQRTNPNIDARRVLNRALKEGLSDLHRAYNLEYQDDIVNRKVEETLKAKEEELKAKYQTPKEVGSPSIPTQFELPKKTEELATTSWSDVTKSVLSDLKEGKLSTP